MFEIPGIRKAASAIFLIFFGLMIGVVGFMVVEGYSFTDALFFTVITMSTVGYGTPSGEPLSDGGKYLSIFIIVFTIGVFLYAITTLTAMVVEGEFREMVRTFILKKEVGKMKDHIIICGLGRNGREAALELLNLGIPILVIESDKDAIDDFRSNHPNPVILQGNATSEELLVRAHTSSARGVICALSDDADNVFVTLIVRELNPNAYIVARASHESTITKLRRSGANRVILPNMMAGKRMARVMAKPALIDFVDFISGEGSSHLNLEEAHCNKDSALTGKSLKELSIKTATGVLVLGIQTIVGSFELNPPSDRILEEGERLFILGSSEQVISFKQKFGGV